MYCVESTVRSLVTNRQSKLDLAEIQGFAALVDAEIDGRLAARFYWPKSSSGVDLSQTPPALIVAAANYLVAALIELKSFSQFTSPPVSPDSGEGPSTYGRDLQRRGYGLLKSIEERRIVIPSLQPSTPIAQSHAPTHNFRPVYGLRRGGRGRN